MCRPASQCDGFYAPGDRTSLITSTIELVIRNMQTSMKGCSQFISFLTYNFTANTTRRIHQHLSVAAQLVLKKSVY